MKRWLVMALCLVPCVVCAYDTSRSYILPRVTYTLTLEEAEGLARGWLMTQGLPTAGTVTIEADHYQRGLKIVVDGKKDEKKEGE